MMMADGGVASARRSRKRAKSLASMFFLKAWQLDQLQIGKRRVLFFEFLKYLEIKSDFTKVFTTCKDSLELRDSLVNP